MNVDIDGSDISSHCLSKTWKAPLSRAASFTIRCPARRVSVAAEISEMHVYQGGDFIFSGKCRQPQATGDADSAYIEITAYDHLIHLPERMVKSSTGNLITPTAVATDAPGMFFEFLQNTIDVDPGTFPLSVNSYAGGGIEVWGALSNFPMNLEQMRELLVATGQLDIYLNPGVGASTLDLENGDSGVDLSGSVVYEYDTGSNNARVATLTVDAEIVANAIWYLLAPRLSETRFRGSITPTAPHKGGTWPADLLARIALSRALYGYRQEIQTKDESGAGFYLRPMYETQWAEEAWLRAMPRTFASVLPSRGTFPTFRPGDLIGVAAGSSMNGGFAGAQRVYEMTVSEDADGAISIDDILTSADGEEPV